MDGQLPHEIVANTMAGEYRKAHHIEQTALVGVDTAVIILRVEVVDTALQS